MKIYRVYTREHRVTIGFGATMEAAQKIKLRFEQEEFEKWTEKFKEVKSGMEGTFKRMCDSNQVKFVGTVENIGNTFEDFLENILNGNKYDEDGNVCKCLPKEKCTECEKDNCDCKPECECTYKTKNSIEIQELEAEDGNV